MTQQMINIGTVANDGTGDTLRAAGAKINSNFTELYNIPPLLIDESADNILTNGSSGLYAAPVWQKTDL